MKCMAISRKIDIKQYKYKIQMYLSKKPKTIEIKKPSCKTASQLIVETT